RGPNGEVEIQSIGNLFVYETVTVVIDAIAQIDDAIAVDIRQSKTTVIRNTAHLDLPGKFIVGLGELGCHEGERGMTAVFIDQAVTVVIQSVPNLFVYTF